MLRSRMGPTWVGLTMVAMTIPVGVAAQGSGRVRVQAPPVRSAPAPAPARRATPKEVPVRIDRARSGNDARGDAPPRSNGRSDDGRWDRESVRRWSVRSESDLRLFGFLGIQLRWDRHDRDDRARWVERYRRYDDRHHRFGDRIDGWYTPRWGQAYFEFDPLRYGPRPLDHRELRRLLDDRTWDRVRREAPGGTSRLWGRVERFGPAGRATTLEIWSGERFVAALTDFDRDGWIDDVVLNSRYWR